MLISHKLVRWLVFLFLPALPIGLALLATDYLWAGVLLALGLVGAVLGLIGWLWPGKGSSPRWLTLPAFVVASCVAGFMAWIKFLRHEENPIWEPTRRTA